MVEERATRMAARTVILEARETGMMGAKVVRAMEVVGRAVAAMVMAEAMREMVVVALMAARSLVVGVEVMAGRRPR